MIARSKTINFPCELKRSDSQCVHNKWHHASGMTICEVFFLFRNCLHISKECHVWGNSKDTVEQRWLPLCKLCGAFVLQSRLTPDFVEPSDSPSEANISRKLLQCPLLLQMRSLSAAHGLFVSDSEWYVPVLGANETDPRSWHAQPGENRHCTY